MKTAIKIDDLARLAAKHNRGDWVLWAELVADAQKHLCRLRINNAAEVARIGKRNITPATRYPKTMHELAALFGVTPKTVYSWQTKGLVKVRQILPTLRYDAKDLLKQVQKQAKKQAKKVTK